VFYHSAPPRVHSRPGPDGSSIASATTCAANVLLVAIWTERGRRHAQDQLWRPGAEYRRGSGDVLSGRAALSRRTVPIGCSPLSPKCRGSHPIRRMDWRTGIRRLGESPARLAERLSFAKPEGRLRDDSIHEGLCLTDCVPEAGPSSIWRDEVRAVFRLVGVRDTS